MITVDVTAEDVQAALDSFLAGEPLDRSCPVARALTRLGSRPVRVYRGAWHLPAIPGGAPATYGMTLPDDVVAYIAAFDAWAKRIASGYPQHPEPREGYVTQPDGRPGPISFVTEVPTRPVPVGPVAVAAKVTAPYVQD